MISIAVCDDDKIFAKSMLDRLAILSQQRQVDCKAKVFHDGEYLVKSVQAGTRFDIIFLDIEMDVVDGLSAAEQIREIDKTALIIFTSSHSQYAIDAYAVRPFQFLVKPFDLPALEKVFCAAIDEILTDDAYFRYFSHGQSFKVPVKDILYFESKLRNIAMVLEHEVRTYREKLGKVENVLDESKVEFWRIHQSLLINRRHICQVKYSEVEMSNGVLLPISASRRSHIRQQYLEKMDKSIIE